MFNFLLVPCQIQLQKGYPQKKTRMLLVNTSSVWKQASPGSAPLLVNGCQWYKSSTCRQAWWVCQHAAVFVKLQITLVSCGLPLKRTGQEKDTPCLASCCYPSKAPQRLPQRCRRQGSAWRRGFCKGGLKWRNPYVAAGQKEVPKMEPITGVGQKQVPIKCNSGKWKRGLKPAVRFLVD